MPVHPFNPLPLSYIIKRSKRAKRLRITVRAGEIIVTAPERTSQKVIKKFIAEHEAWIFQKVKFYEQSIPSWRKEGFQGGEEILYRGKTLNLVIVESDSVNCPTLREGSRLIVYTGHGLKADEKQKQITGALEGWLRERARELITDLAQDMAKQLRVQFGSIRIKDQKTRWGSCSRQGNLNFNWRLVMAPPEVLEYVVAHEAAHLVHMNHSSQFWQTVASLVPGYAEPRKWLKEHGRRLQW